ncbi:adenylosuccinate lyase [Vulcanisaeta sp. JCM 16161]|uniref:adenylosuccinate lyase n=1 Tax=Vulcanisaeta sp. JCM 16161 TaxID=1295372 RepID=UPI0006D03607|nr:adenylosuccinate lyase [Vulcanisaeta sp. JCM 16161]
MDSISPLDDRYYEELRDYAAAVSERAFTKYRLRIEVLYLNFLINLLSRTGLAKPLTDGERERLLSLRFNDDDYGRFKEIEGKLGHDVKAIEYLLREKLGNAGLGRIAHLTHLGLTSEDVNNLALGILVRIAVYNYLMPELTELLSVMVTLMDRYAGLPMLGRTHGQPATPTTLGKEIAYHACRLTHWLSVITDIKLQGKVSGATGSMASFSMISRDIDWIEELSRFVRDLGFEPAIVTTQILPPDSLTHLLTSIGLMSQALINLAQDLWMYNMLGYVRIGGKPIGSSTMPHKVNPVDLENAEGNLKLGSSILMEISRHIQVSRLQRDLSDSTIKRNVGLGIGHVILGVRRLSAVLRSINVDEDAINRDLNNHWEVLSEAVQVRLRALGMADAYEKALTIFRGSRMGAEDYGRALGELGVNDEALRALSPGKYIGYARELTMNCVSHCKYVLEIVKSRVNYEINTMKSLGFLEQ